EKFLKFILDESKNIGDYSELSKEDMSVLALCVQLKGELVTDDYTVSNVARHLNLKVIPIMTKGISKVLDSVYLCPACNKSFKKMSDCPICGSKLRKNQLRESQSQSAKEPLCRFTFSHHTMKSPCVLFILVPHLVFGKKNNLTYKC
ncbi:MAG TPA: hypothetical protein VFV16_04095, partial [Candidatus Nitrosotalea sp.]|nr:hypothetical protein [Candidatus Nitrosotalea sp.]